MVSSPPPLIGTARRARHGYSDRLVVWAHPAYANKHIIVRNDEEVVRYSLASEDY